MEETTYDKIVKLFKLLNRNNKVSVLSELYGSMTDGEKDAFLEEIENY